MEQGKQKRKEIVQKGIDAFSVFQRTASTSTCLTLRAKSLVSQDAVLFHLLAFTSSPEPVALPKAAGAARVNGAPGRSTTNRI